jgi:hypothetical protein
MKMLFLIVSFLTSFLYLPAQPGNDRILNSLKSTFSLSVHDRPDHIVQFNKDTILVSGYLSQGSVTQNVVFQTFDGGKTWKKNYFKGDAWIYDYHFLPDGKVWMGGSDEYVHYSDDFGTNWTRKPKPLVPANRVHAIYMSDSVNGIAGGLHNGLAITNDNWQTTRQIPTPLSQQKFRINQESSRDRVDKVQMIGSLILINQNDHIYYSKLNPVEWKSFNVPVRNFSIDQSKNSIELFSSMYKVYVLDTGLKLTNTYYEPEGDLVTRQSVKPDFIDFLASGIRSIKIEGVKYHAEVKTGLHHNFTEYTENVQKLRVKKPLDFATIKNILTTCDSYTNPVAATFSFSKEDLDDYLKYYNIAKSTRQKETVWGGDFSYLLDQDNELFLNPQKTLQAPIQPLLDSVYRDFAFPYPYMENSPHCNIYVVNNNSDTLKITNKTSALYSLPWIIEHKNGSFETYDLRITEFLKAKLPEKFYSYHTLFAGELIYRLIEQRILNEMTYKKD